MASNNTSLSAILDSYDPARWRETERRYQLYLEQHPADHQAMHLLGQLYLHQTLTDKAIYFFQQAIKYLPTSSLYLLSLSQAFIKQSKWDTALSHLLAAFDINPQDDAVVLMLGTLFEKMNQPQKALTWYAKALQINPESDAIHYQVGLYFLKQNRFGDAIKQFQNVILLNDNHMKAYFYLGSIYLSQNELDKANDYYLKALAIDEENSDCLVNLGTIRLKQHKPQEAIHCFAKALSYNNDCIEAQHNLASTFMQHDRFDNALTHYEELLKHDPDNIEYRYNMGVAHMMLGSLEDAITFFTGLLTIQPAHVDSLVNLAAICSRLDHPDKTQYYLKQALQLNPNDKASRFMLDALTGQTITDVPRDYIRNLFDNYAYGYDYHLKEKLNYQLPSIIEDQLSHFCKPKAHSILELGVGTGLMGPILTPYASSLIGIDISPKMLSQAEKRGHYDKLISSDIIDYLKTNTTLHDLIIAADVLPYLGELTLLFKLLVTRLSQAGQFLFTIEETLEHPLVLTKTGRFKHHPDYIQKTLGDTGLLPILEKPIIARYQDQQPVHARLYIVRLS